MTSAVVLFVIVAAGSHIAFVRQERVRSILLAVAAGPAIGLGCVFLVSFFILFVGIRLTFFSVAIGMVFTLALFAIGRPAAERGQETGMSVDTSWPALRMVLIGAVVVTVGALGIAAYLWIQSAPHGSADAVNFWTSRGLFLNRVDGDIALRFSFMKKGHPTYPLFLPSALAGQYTLAGNESLLTPQLTGIVALAALLLLVWAVTHHFGGSLRAALAVLLVGSTPVLWRWAFMQCADVLVSYLFLLSAASLFSLATRKSSALFSPFLTGFFLGMLFSTKTEGHAASILLVTLGLGFAFICGRGIQVVRQHGPGLLAGLAPGVMATLLFRLVWCRNVEALSFIRSDFLHAMTDPQRWKSVVTTVIGAYDPTRSMEIWGILWLFIVLVLTIQLSKILRGNFPTISFPLFLFFACGGMLFAYGTAYVLTPYNLDWQIERSIDRLLLQLAPSFVTAAILTIGPLGFGTRPAEQETVSRHQ